MAEPASVSDERLAEADRLIAELIHACYSLGMSRALGENDKADAAHLEHLSAKAKLLALIAAQRRAGREEAAAWCREQAAWHWARHSEGVEPAIHRIAGETFDGAAEDIAALGSAP